MTLYLLSEFMSDMQRLLSHPICLSFADGEAAWSRLAKHYITEAGGSEESQLYVGKSFGRPQIVGSYTPQWCLSHCYCDR